VQEYFLSGVQNARVRKYPSVFLPCTSQKKHTSVFPKRKEYTGDMSIYEILPALDLTQSVHAKISIGMHQGVGGQI
jgi:hypothetical protein